MAIKHTVDRITVEMHPALKKRLKMTAEKTSRSMNGYCVFAIRKQVELDENTN